MLMPPNYTPSKELLADRVIAITGAGDGIGRTMAKAYAAYGATVILLGRTTSKLESVYDEIETAGHPKAAIVPIDFASADTTAYGDLSDNIASHFGRLDGLLHNAAALGERTSIRNYKYPLWQQLVQVNITAPFLLTQALLPLLDKGRQASIIFTGSSVGYQGRAYWGAYAMTKAANENFMQTLADELEGTSDIRANSINPGGTRTPMRAQAFPAENPDTVKTAEVLIPLYVYLMGEDSNGVNGQQFSMQLMQRDAQ
ncbi:MAG: YciK family oxidoreductase [Cellvibrionaceae bacterium]|nr:YciK family oxidoreductase [Cellvibrionaceae bacterium]